MARPISSRYKRRIANIGPETARARREVAALLEEGLQEATQEQLYDRTPLKVSRKMMKSISARIKGATVSVGYDRRKARYAPIRLNMKGKSKLGKHQLDMQPSEYMRRVTNPKIKKVMRAAKRRIIR